MSIFDNITNPINDQRIEMWVKLKYGEIIHDYEWIEKLPEIVIHRAVKKIDSDVSCNAPICYSIQILSIWLRQPSNKEKARIAIKEALIEYHMLAG